MATSARVHQSNSTALVDFPQPRSFKRKILPPTPTPTRRRAVRGKKNGFVGLNDRSRDFKGGRIQDWENPPPQKNVGTRVVIRE